MRMGRMSTVKASHSTALPRQSEINNTAGELDLPVVKISNFSVLIFLFYLIIYLFRFFFETGLETQRQWEDRWPNRALPSPNI